MNIGMKRPLSMSLEDALTKVPETLKEEGFGVFFTASFVKPAESTDARVESGRRT